MEKKTSAKKGTTSKKKTVGKDQYIAAYIEHVLEEGKNPASVFSFAKSLGSTEAEFYSHFNSFKALERAIWANWFDETVQVLEKDPAYADYTVREKILAFYFTWLEGLLNNRSFVLKRFEELDKRDLNPYFLEGVRDPFKNYINDLILEGKDTSEIADRPYFQGYDKAFWFHFLFITRFWVNDDSSDYEKTDAAVEKSVNLAFDLVGKGPIDSMVDFGKFLFQNR